MTDDEIRALLLQLGRVTFDTPTGFVRVGVAKVAERADLRTVAVWIANNGGLVEGTEPYEARQLAEGRLHREVAPAEESFLVPERALHRGGVSARTAGPRSGP